MTIIACCDNCDARNVPGSHYEGGTDRAYGSDTTQCYVCQGDDFDPYCEMEEFPRAGAEPCTIAPEHVTPCATPAARDGLPGPNSEFDSRDGGHVKPETALTVWRSATSAIIARCQSLRTQARRDYASDPETCAIVIRLADRQEQRELRDAREQYERVAERTQFENSSAVGS